jgi:cell division transport system permease protein
MSIRSRYGTNFISSVLSIGLVLFLLGLIGAIILHGNQIANHVRENIVVTVMLQDNSREAEIFNLQKNLDSNPMVLSTLLVTPQEAADRLIADTGEDFVSFLGYIPLPHSIDVYVKSEFANMESLNELQAFIQSQNIVKDVYFDKDLIDVVNDNIARISIILASIAMLLLVISIVLINNTMRLHIYSKRFLIKSMLLVGASHGFIRKPFLGRGFWIGIGGAALSIAMLISTISFFQKQIPDLKNIFNLDTFVMLLAFIVATGIFISVVSSAIAVRKYVRLDQDSLYK